MWPAPSYESRLNNKRRRAAGAGSGVDPYAVDHTTINRFGLPEDDVEQFGAASSAAVDSTQTALDLFQPLDVVTAPTGAWLDLAGQSYDAPLETNDLSPLVGYWFPHFLPAIPAADTSPVEPQPNPFLNPDEAEVVHPVLRRPAGTFTPVRPLTNVNGFLKFRNIGGGSKKRKTPGPLAIQHPLLNTQFPPRWVPGQQQGSVALRDLDLRASTAHVPLLPPNFGNANILNQTDRLLFKFFLTAIVPGRTVINGDNVYESELAKMAGQDDMVRHCLLSLSATYVMDFQQAPVLLCRAGFHHKKAIELIGQALNSLEDYPPGKEVALLAALYLLSHNEIVNWETETRESSPKWYRSGKAAEYILRKTDQAYRYALPKNVQSTYARTQLAVLFCLDNVMSDCIYPLDLSVKEVSFPWLIYGTDREQRTIVGMAGLSPKLTHFIAKCTFLAASLSKNPTALASLTVAEEVARCLERFHQVSSISQACHYTIEELLESCTLDDKGVVGTSVEVTDLIGFSYVAATQIYLQCRVFRRPKTYPTVQRVLDQLLLCIDRQPISGNLFTAQTPLFAVFIGGIVAYKPRHREIITKWFLPICDDVRGNVPPAWRAIRKIWEWMDARPIPDEQAGGDEVPLVERDPWWEDLTEVLSEWEGRMNLS